MARTIGEIARRYNEKRDDALAKVRKGEISASMSALEYYPKPWEELDLGNEGDLYIVSTNLTWSEVCEEHDLDGLERVEPELLNLHRERRKLFFMECGEERNALVREADGRILAKKVEALKQWAKARDVPWQG